MALISPGLVIKAFAAQSWDWIPPIATSFSARTLRLDSDLKFLNHWVGSTRHESPSRSLGQSDGEYLIDELASDFVRFWGRLYAPFGSVQRACRSCRRRGASPPNITKLRGCCGGPEPRPSCGATRVRNRPDFLIRINVRRVDPDPETGCARPAPAGVLNHHQSRPRSAMRARDR